MLSGCYYCKLWVTFLCEIHGTFPVIAVVGLNFWTYHKKGQSHSVIYNLLTFTITTRWLFNKRIWGLLQALHTPQARPNFQCAENKQYLVPYSHSVGKRNVHPLREKTYVVVHLLVLVLGTCSSNLITTLL
jgi:hypothetical protein